MSDTFGEDLFGATDDATASDAYRQDGPDLFGTEPDELILPTEPDPETAGDLDGTDEIPIDADDEPETQATAEDVSDADVAVLEAVAASAPPAPGSDRPTTQAAASPGPVAGPAPVAKRALESERPDAPLALYRRYRPETFAQVIGQDHVTEPLRRALVNNRVNHAYLFSGPRGCGKTSSARILARCLNCEQGLTPEPCGECQSCRDLARGGAGSIDVIEIDAASHGGVNEARDLRERAFFAPVHSRYKIYIIDEAHMVTKEGFNALLKLVEEPPPHVKFIFATTEPEKVLGTIRSRTHHYPFRLVPPKVLAGYLDELCVAEGVDVDRGVLPLVVRAGAGSVRDSLSVLDQLLGGAEQSGVSYRQATALLGYTPDTLLDEIMDAFAAGDAEGVFAAVDKVIEVGQDPRRFAEDLLRRLRDLIIVAAVPEALTSGLVDVAGDQAERLTVQARGMGAGELTRAAEVIAKGLTDMRGTTAPRLHLELMCSRVLLPGADVDDRGLHARLDRLERRLNMVGDAAVPAAHPIPQPAPQPTDSVPDRSWPERSRETARAEQPSAPAEPTGRHDAGVHRERPAADPRPAAGPAVQSRQDAPVARPAPEVGERTDDAWPEAARPGRPSPAHDADAAAQAGTGRPVGDPHHGRPGAPAQPPQQSQAQPGPGVEPVASTVAAASGGDPGTLGAADVRRMWPQILDAVKGRRRVTWIVLSQNAQVHDFADGVLTLALNNPGARESFGRGGSPDILREAIIEVLGIAPRIETIVGGDPGQRPADPPAAPPSASQQATRAASERPSGPGERPASTGVGHPSPVEPPAQPSGRDRREPPTVGTPEPPPEDDDFERPNFADLARQNIRQAKQSGPASEPPAEQSRDDVDLDADVLGVDELLAKELGARLIAEEPE